MRTTGYILMIVGFLWLLFVDFVGGASLRSLDSSYREKYPYTNNYSGGQLHQALIGVVKDYRSDVPGVVAPAILMLVGGILLDQAARQVAKRKPPIIHREKPVA